MSSTIDIINTENVVSAAQKVHDGQESTATTVQGVGILGILESGKISLESESGRVSASGVVKADWLAWVRLSKGGRKVNSRGDSTKLRIGLVTAVNSSCAESTII